MKIKNIFGAGLIAAASAVILIFAVQATQVNMAIADEVVPVGDFARGVGLWSQNCARCHNMRDPKEFRDDLWQPIVTHMRIRAGLTGQDARDILVFLQGSN